MRNRLGRAAVLATLASLAGAGAAHAAAAPQLAVGADGTAHVVWSHVDTTFPLGQWNTRGADGTIGDGDYFTPAGASSFHHDVAVAPTGRAVAVWAESTANGFVVKLRRRGTDGSFSAVQTLSEAGVLTRPAVGMDADGDALVAWNRMADGKPVVEIRRRAADGSLSAVQRLSASSPTYGAFNLDMAVDPAGNAYVSWQVASPTAVIQARRRAANGTLSAIQNVTGGTVGSTAPQVGVDASGNATFAWMRMKGTGYQLQTRRRSAAGALGTIQDVSPLGSSASNHRLAVAPGGAAHFTWHRTVPGQGQQLETRRRAPGGALGDAEQVSTGPSSTADGRVAVDADGDAVFAWRQVGGETSYVKVRRRTSEGVYSQALEASPVDGDISDLELGVEPGGAAVMSWLKKGPIPVVQVRRRTAAGELSTIDRISS